MWSFIGFTFLPNTTHNNLGVIVEDGKVKPNTYVGLSEEKYSFSPNDHS